MNKIKKKFYPQFIKKFVIELYVEKKLLTEINFKVTKYSHVNKNWKNTYNKNKI